MTKLSICLLGGTGFVGAHLLARLAQAGHRVRVATRHRERDRALAAQPGVSLVEADIFDPQSLGEILRGCDVVINLVGVLSERGRDGRGFYHVHVELPSRLLQAAQGAGVTRLLHMSALGADAVNGVSHYQRTKGEGEDLVHASDLHVTSFRPSVIFGAGDAFFNRFAKLLRNVPWLFPLACPEARFQPVFVGDVVSAFAHSLTRQATFGKRYDLCGPHVYTLQQLVEYTAHLVSLNRRVIPLPDLLSRMQARMLELVPGKPFSMDNYRSMQHPNVCTSPWPDVFDLTPASIEEIVPGYVNPSAPL